MNEIKPGQILAIIVIVVVVLIAMVSYTESSDDRMDRMVGEEMEKINRQVEREMENY